MGTTVGLFRQTFRDWLEDKAPQLGAALAYYTVFSLAPLIVLLLAIVGFLFRQDPAGAWQKMTEQMSYFLDKSAIEVVQNIARQSSQGNKGPIAMIIGVALALFGASGVFGQLQDALNTIWEVRPNLAVAFWGLYGHGFSPLRLSPAFAFSCSSPLRLRACCKLFPTTSRPCSRAAS